MKEYQYILTYGALTETLGVNPAGYDKLGITFMRHEFYHSVLRSFTLSLRFLNITLPDTTTGGYQFIKHAYDTDGIFAEVSIEIKKRNPDTNDYDSLYTGVLDFTPDKWTIDRELFWEIGIIDSSVLQKFISRDENEINLLTDKTIEGEAITPLTPVTLYLPPVDITVKAKGTFEITEAGYTDVFEKFLYPDNPVYELKESDNIDINGTDTIYTNNLDSQVLASFVIDGDYRLIGPAGAAIRYQLFFIVYTDGGSVVDTKTIYDYTYSAAYNTYGTILIEDDYTLLPGYYVKMYLRITYIGALTTYNIEHNINFYVVDKVTGYAQTECNGILSHEAADQSIKIITDNGSNLNSDLLGRIDLGYDSDGEISLISTCNGRAIRNYPDTKLNITFRDWFKSIDSIWNVGLWFDNSDNTMSIEKKETFFNSAYAMFNLGEVSKFKISSYNLSYFSKISAGYDYSGSYERIQGAHEFAVKREYSTAAKVKEEKNIRTNYRFDTVGIEETRTKQYITTESEDLDEDNDIFMILMKVVLGGYSPEFPSAGDFSVSSLGFDIFGTYYNLYLTPRQNAIRWGNILKSCHYKNTGSFQAQKTDKQYELEIGGVDENSDIALSELETPLFIPEKYIFEGYLTPTQIAILLANPHGYIDFTYNGINYAGFIDKVELGDYNKKATFELIAKDTSIDIRTFEDGSLHTFEDGTQKYGE